MKKLLLLLPVMIFTTLGFAQTGPKIEFVAKDNTIDYGSVYKESDNGIRYFEFKNTGNAPLIITNVQSTCGCTIPSYPKTPVMPGQTEKIEVRYNMAPGPIRKTITVESNAVNHTGGQVALKIKGEVLVKKEINVLEKKKSIMSQD